jgi:hypothetical protein
MPFQGACALLSKPEQVSVFLVAKLRSDPRGRIESVLLTEMDRRTRMLLSAEEVPVSEVIDLIHSGHSVCAMFASRQEREVDRRFAVALAGDGQETIVLDGPATPGRELRDIVGYNEHQPPVPAFVSSFSRHAYRAGDSRGESPRP